jgi:hypothetical protein
MIHPEPVDRRNMQADECSVASAPAFLVNAKAERLNDEGKDSWGKLFQLAGTSPATPSAAHFDSYKARIGRVNS